jgi:type II secretory pathway pseudopilin PulG
MKSRLTIKQSGVSLVGLILVLAMLGLLGVLALKIAPTATEFMSIKKAIETAKASGTTVREIQISFDKQAEVGYITTISGKDLEITRNGDDVEISFAYQKKIPLVGPASLLLEYAGTTAKNSTSKTIE